ncbi:hypothetical protein FOA43_001752 [Brettanomyces nanus]|uniref:Uncharacterized protein n=1 Tax=Eeniella nana TaxID=13502 RepID=A0A875S0J9_EENNA|nr:uncharacterized protein FOA43_001752 [Brettanomyces nanus]QPG74423.1 hypothetical protein FOA43_001752 [Brettanomyces nanus]
MIIGYLVYGKIYEFGQILGSCVISLGIIVVTYSNITDHVSNNSIASEQPNGDLLSFIKGLVILIGVTMLTSFLSLYNESSNRIVSKSNGQANWKENLLYSHLYGLPFFLIMSKSLFSEYQLIENLRKKHEYGKYWWLLLVNNVTQLLCVTGVNRLAVVTSAVTLGVILLMRRFISLLLSMILFKNRLSPLGIMGTLMVFIGAAIYSYTVGKIRDEKSKKD